MTIPKVVVIDLDTPLVASAPATDTAALLKEYARLTAQIFTADDDVDIRARIRRCREVALVDLSHRLAAALRASEERFKQLQCGRFLSDPSKACISMAAYFAVEADRDRALAALALAEWKLTVRDSAGPRPWKEWEYDDQARDEGFIPRPSPKEASDA